MARARSCHGDLLRVREEQQVSIFKIQKKMSAGPSLALSAQSQAVLSEASRNGDTLGSSCRCCSMSGAQPHMVWRLPKQNKKGVKQNKKGPSLSGHLPPALAFPIPHTSSNTRHCLCPLPSWPPRPSSPQGFPLPGFPAAAACPYLISMQTPYLRPRPARQHSIQETNFQGYLLLTENFQRLHIRIKAYGLRGGFSGWLSRQSATEVIGGPTWSPSYLWNAWLTHYSTSLISKTHYLLVSTMG